MSKNLLASLSVTMLLLGCNAPAVEDVKASPAQGSPATPAQGSPGQPVDGSPQTSASQEQPVAPELSRTQILESRLKKIVTAFHAFHSEFGHFPPAGSRDVEGNLLLSWRVHLLPFLGYEDLYNEFHFDEPWDSPHNSALIEKMPEEYSTGEPGLSRTSFVVFLGDEAVFGGKRAEQWSRPLRPYVRDKQSAPLKTEESEEEQAAFMRRAQRHGGPRMSEIQDGTSNTILVVQAGDDRQVPWTKPEDVPFQPENPMVVLGAVPEAGFLALYCDGQVKLIARDVTSEKLAAAITRAGRDYDR